MRILVIVLLLTSFTIASFGNSYAQSQSNLLVFVQIRVQDSNGNLVSYLEPQKITVLDMAKLNLLLDQNSPLFQKSFTTYGGQKFEVVKATDIVVHPSATIVSSNFMSVSNGRTSQALVIVDHDGYPVAKGDKVITYWTVVRPV